MNSVKTGLSGRLGDLPKVGGTPLADLGSPEVRAKIEWMNPSGSVKDRAATWMVNEALESGLLDSGKVIIEPSSGNMGIALASAAARLGLTAEIVVPEKVSMETKEMLRKLGASVVETTDDLCPRVGKGTDQCIALASSLRASRPELYYMPNQYENMANFRAHYFTTGPEIWKETHGRIDAFVAGVGTGGTITGVARYLKEKRDVRVIAVQPQPDHKIQGLRNMEESLMPKVLESGASFIDEWVTVSNDEAFEGVRRLAKERSLFVGPSSGAVFAAHLKSPELKGGRVVMMFGDSGLKYRTVYRENGVFSDAEMDALQGTGPFSELAYNSNSPASRAFRGEI
ncbi:MAG TPA: cysteine synthase family protein [Conexivisphaerales archaeon]|nr:cysteine synthase family protein [Conexivisphaerales archaeon]